MENFLLKLCVGFAQKFAQKVISIPLEISFHSIPGRSNIVFMASSIHTYWRFPLLLFLLSLSIANSLSHRHLYYWKIAEKGENIYIQSVQGDWEVPILLYLAARRILNICCNFFAYHYQWYRLNKCYYLLSWSDLFIYGAFLYRLNISKKCGNFSATSVHAFKNSEGSLRGVPLWCIGIRTIGFYRCFQTNTLFRRLYCVVCLTPK